MRRGSCATLVAVLALGLITGCGGDDDDNPYFDAAPLPDAVDAFVSIDAEPPDAEPPDAEPEPDASWDDRGPTVHVTSPTAATGLTSDLIVTSGRFTAVCTAEVNPATGSPVDPATVIITAIGEGVERQAFASPTPQADEFEADMVVDDFPNGPLTIRCEASDSASPPRTNMDEIETYLDLGPRILVLNPLDDMFYANEVNVSFKVLPYPIDVGDTMAAPNYGSVTVSVAGVDLVMGTDVVQNPPDSGTFTGTVTFDDPRFSPSLEGAQTLTITAANTRTPTAVTRERDVVFAADSQGPAIQFNEPAPGEFISGIFLLSATVSDPAGVDPTSVIATVAGTYEFALTSTGGDGYAGWFDTRKLPNTMVFPAVVLRAKDSVGNQGAAGMLLTLDNRPPILSLDPPNMREYRTAEDAEGNLYYECSWLFDPLGGAFDPLGVDPDFGDAVDDGETVGQLSEIRARVEDRGNGDPDDFGVYVPLAGVDPGSVELFVLDDEEGALLVDTDGDGYCDNINPLIQPTSVPTANNEAAVINLSAIGPSGAAYYAPITGADPAQPLFATSGPETQLPRGGAVQHGCSTPEVAEDLPDPLCLTVVGSHVIDTEVGSDPVIFGIPPFNEYACMGNAFDSVATNISDGWACLALRATDYLGNVGISAPMRVCFDHDDNQAECPAMGTITTTGLDDCTGTYDPDTGTTDASTDCVLRVEDGLGNVVRSWLFEDDAWLQLRNSES